MPTYSHSRIGSYENCPLQYKYHYIDKIKTDRKQSVEGFMGNMVHDTLEKLYNELKNSKVNTIDELIEYYNSIWKEKWADEILIVKKDLTQDNYKDTGEKAIRDYYERFKPFDTNTIQCEMKLNMDFDGYQLTGYIDRVVSNEPGVYEIHDYKTSSRLPTQEKAEEDRQLALYSIGLKQSFQDCKDVKLIWHYLKFDKDIVVTKTDEQLEELKKGLVAKIKEIEAATEFPSNRTALCDWCEYKKICPEWKDMYPPEEGDSEPLFTDVDGKELVDRYAELKVKRKEIQVELDDLKEKAIGYANANDITRIFGTDHEIIVTASTDISLPGKNDDNRPDLIQLLKDIGKYDEIAETDFKTSTLKKIIKEKQWPDDILTKLKGFVEEKESVRVSLKKKEE